MKKNQCSYGFTKIKIKLIVSLILIIFIFINKQSNMKAIKTLFTNFEYMLNLMKIQMATTNEQKLVIIDDIKKQIDDVIQTDEEKEEAYKLLDAIKDKYIKEI